MKHFLLNRDGADIELTPMPDAHFKAIIRLCYAAIFGGVAVAITAIAGIHGLLIAAAVELILALVAMT